MVNRCSLIRKVVFCSTGGTFLLALCFSAEAQQQKEIRKIAYLTAGSAASPRSTNNDAFRRGLRDHGLVEGKNLIIEHRYAEGIESRLSDLATELVQLKPDVMFTENTSAALALKNATTTIPIVFVLTADPIAIGLVASLARPGGNITGLTIFGPELSGKRLALLKRPLQTLPVWRSYGTPLILLMNSCGKRPRRWHTNYVSSSNLWKCGVPTILTLHSKPP